MISHRHRCIYVKMPKCASTSVLEWFLVRAGGRYTDRPSWYPGPLEHRIVPTATAMALYPGYFTFTFLRHPYRRFLSVYRHAERLAGDGAPGRPRGYGTLREFAELCAELLHDTRGLWGREALAFRARHAERRYGPLGIPLRELRFVLCHARPQVDFLPECNPGGLFGVARAPTAPLSFVGAVESLDAHFALLRDRLGLPDGALPRRNVSHPRPGAAEALRRDTATRRIVDELYAQDFAFAGYPRGDPHGRAPALPRHGEPARAGAIHGARGLLRASGRAGGRARLAICAAEMALEARIARAPALRRALAPLARLRRRLA